MRMICSCEMKWSVLDSLVEHGRPSGSSGHAHTKLLLLARHRCVQPPLLTAQWFVPAMSLMVTDLSIMRITHNKNKHIMFISSTVELLMNESYHTTENYST